MKRYLIVPGGDIARVIGSVAVCPRHGRPREAEVTLRVGVRPRPRGGLSMMRVAEAMEQRLRDPRVTKLADAPFCRVCSFRRVILSQIACLLTYGGFSVTVFMVLLKKLDMFADTAFSTPFGSVMAYVMFAPIVGLAVLVPSMYPWILNAWTSFDGKSVVFVSPHPRFCDEVTTLVPGVVLKTSRKPVEELRDVPWESPA